MLQVWKIGKNGKGDCKEDLVVGITLYRNKISEEKEVDNDVGITLYRNKISEEKEVDNDVNIKQAG